MVPHLLEWLELSVRWLHVIAGVAWIGASFYFVWLNNHLRPPPEARPGVAGELWAVHGGHFYQVSRFAVAPERLPETLHWFKWEAYVTWLSGASLLVLVYYLGGAGFLTDPAVAELSHGAAVGIGVGTLVGGWLIYDLLCRSPLRHHPRVFAAVGFALATAAAFGLTQVFSARAAYIHVGATLGTCMAANVFFVIIPNQRRMVDAMIRGEAPDGELGRAGALRSLHNNYMTLPVLFIMVSGHYPITYGHAWNWAILAGLSLSGAVIRHWFNLRGRGQHNVILWPLAVAGVLALAFVTRPATIDVGGDVPDFATKIHPIIQQRCTPCHARETTWPGIVGPQKGVL
ncbi:MAG: urate hydroxylase PuuD, partial [Myxococcales bacterium]|nr:urate hydroxylase PuuD [Myxococcales bacterium]